MSITRFTGVSGPGDSRELVEHVTMTDDVGKLVAHAIYKAWQSDERWLRLDLATVAKGNPLAFFWAEIAASAALAANSRSPTTWQPFETAPKDGRWIIARCNDHSALFYVSWGIDRLGTPTWCGQNTSYGDGLFMPRGDWTEAPQPGEER